MAMDAMGYAKKVYGFIEQEFTEEIEQMMRDAIEPPKIAFSDQ